MRITTLLLILQVFGFLLGDVKAQYVVGSDTLYGHEWIESNVDYLKVSVGDQGLTRIEYSELVNSGFTTVIGRELRLQSCGQDQPIYVSNENQWGAGDFLLFNSSFNPCKAYDHSTYDNVEAGSMLNPDFPTYSDTLVYFLSQQVGHVNRFGLVDQSTPVATDTIVSALSTIKPIQIPSRFGKVVDRFSGGYSSFRAFEGFGYGPRQKTTLTYRTTSRVAGSTAAFTVRAKSSIIDDHRFFIQFNGDTVLTQNTGSVVFLNESVSLANTALNSSNENTVVIGGALASSDRFDVGQAYLRYTRQLSLSSADDRLYVQTGTTQTQLTWNVTGVAPTDRLLAINMQTNQLAFQAPGETYVYLPASAQDSVMLMSTAGLLTADIAAANFGEDLSAGTDYLVISSKQQTGWSVSPIDWAQYRASAAGGGWSSQVVYIEDIYNRYGYGIARSPLAVRSAISFLGRNRPDLHVLLIGKGLEFGLVRSAAQIAAVDSSTYFIPTFGTPGADNLLAFNPLTREMTASLGRLAVQNEVQLNRIFDKVRAADLVPNLPQNIAQKEWSKKLIHLVGGGNVDEQAQFKVLMDNASQALVTSEFGASFSSYYKDSQSPIQQADSDELFADINEGSRFLTFLGHGSQSTLDFNIDLPDRYNNAGRLPMMNALGCFTGNMHTPGLSLGERFLLEDDEIALSFGASTGLGYPFQLTAFLTDFYQGLGGQAYGNTSGFSYRSAFQNLMSSGSRISVQLGEQFNFQGDPGVVVDAGIAPDYIFRRDKVSFSPQPLIAGLDTVTMDFEIVNLGRNLVDTLSVVLERSIQGGEFLSVDTTQVLAAGGAIRGVFRFESGANGGGLNTFKLSLFSKLQQGPLPSATSNDVLSNVQVFFLDRSVSITYPPKAGVLGVDEPLVVYATSGTPWGPTRNFEWQWSLDEAFPASSTQQVAVASKSLIRLDLEGQVPNDVPVYVRLRDLEADSIWSYTHFKRASRIQPDEVVSISSLGQFKQADQFTLRVDSTDHWSFARFELSKSLRNKEYISTDPPSFVVNYDGPAGSVKPWLYLRSGIAVLIGDPITSRERFNAAPGEFGSINGGGFNRAFMYPGDTRANRDDLVKLLDSVATPGSYIYFFTCFRPGFDLDVSSWNSDSTQVGERTVFGILREHGAQLLPQWSTSGTVPYTAIFRKDQYGMLAEAVGANREDVIFTEVFLNLSSDEGTYVTESLPNLISGEELTWEVNLANVNRAGNSIDVTLVGTTFLGDTIHVAQGTGATGSLDISDVDFQAFQDYKIELYQQDSLREAFAINSLTIKGKPLPEYVFDPSSTLTIPQDSVELGDVVNFGLGIRRLGRDTSRAEVQLETLRLSDSLALTKDTLQFSVGQSVIPWIRSFLSQEPIGDQSNIYSLRPLTERRDLVAANNSTARSLHVRGDGIAPLAKVYYDGELVNSDLLTGPNPSFRLEVFDAGSKVALIESIELELTLVTPNNETLSGSLFPGETTVLSSNNVASKAEYQLDFSELQDGIYTLQFRVKDMAGNVSGVLQSSQFEVSSAVAISNILPYPNPMVDRVKFHYELTGAPPSSYQIDIYSTSGRLVRSLGPQDLGSLSIGRHTTDLSWDGTTQHGERLGAGTYLYRFSVDDDKGEQIEHRGTEMDTYIKSGFGKLVILPK